MGSKILTFAILALATEFVAASFLSDLATKTGCVYPGLTCQDCQTIMNCIVGPDGTLISGQSFTCPQGTKCSEGHCTMGWCDSALFDLECKQNGIFPHLFDCEKYFICFKDTDGTFKKFRGTCPSGFFYEPTTMLCSRNIESNDTCEALIKKPCAVVGEYGGVIQHPQLYYQCIADATDPKLVKTTMYYCPGDKIFYNKQCWNPSIPDLYLNKTCRDTGKFYNPDCKKYFLCSAAGKIPGVNNCVSGQHYDVNKEECVPFTC